MKKYKEVLIVRNLINGFITSWRHILVGKRGRLLVTVYGLGKYRLIKESERR